MTLVRQRPRSDPQPEVGCSNGPVRGLALSPTADVLLSDRATGTIPPLGHHRPPKRRRPPRVPPGGLSHASRAKIRLGKALHVLEPAIDAHRSARARIPAAWERMAARSLHCLEQLGFGLGSQGQGQHGVASSWTAKGGRPFICSWRSGAGQETKRILSTNQSFELVASAWKARSRGRQ